MEDNTEKSDTECTNDEESEKIPQSILEKLSRGNAKVNAMTESQLIKRLKFYKLHVEGDLEVKRKRLKMFYQSCILSNPKPPLSLNTLPFYVVIDFEATCEDPNPPNYLHEIIEFPAILVETDTQTIVDKFHSYCKPSRNPLLSDFCKSLTGIQQETVDDAELFSVVVKNFEKWLQKHNLIMMGSKKNCALVTDGPWDVCRFLYVQCVLSALSNTVPSWATCYVNIRKIFGNFYGVKRATLAEMLEKLELEFKGRPHSGIDDAYNIALILSRLLADGAHVLPNEIVISQKKKLSTEDHLIPPAEWKPLVYKRHPTKQTFWKVQKQMRKLQEETERELSLLVLNANCDEVNNSLNSDEKQKPLSLKSGNNKKKRNKNKV